jgi:hypothetical protein
LPRTGNVVDLTTAGTPKPRPGTRIGQGHRRREGGSGGIDDLDDLHHPQFLMVHQVVVEDEVADEAEAAGPPGVVPGGPVIGTSPPAPKGAEPTRR